MGAKISIQGFSSYLVIPLNLESVPDPLDIAASTHELFLTVGQLNG
jgi:hypothetical protein